MRIDKFLGITRALVVLALVQPAFGETGVTPGAFDISSAGAATYSIPIFAPPGPRGMQPSIALTYNSQAGKGVSGVGWGISGLSSIERCWKSKGQDGAQGGIGFTVHDRFCLNGNRLRLVSGTPYGGPNTIYQTEMADFSEITALGVDPSGIGPASFIAKGKNGLTYEYGATADSSVYAGTLSTVFRWKLNKVSDRYGNNYVIVYSKENATSHAVPDTIRWTRTSSTATGATDYTYLMKFHYIARGGADGSLGFLNSQLVQNGNRLQSITVKYVNGGSERTIRRYELSYTLREPDLISLLTSVKECSDDSDDHCFAPTSFTYQPGAGLTATAGNINTSGTPTIQGQGDFNGDGKEDIVYTVSSSWYVAFGGVAGISHIANVTGLSAAAAAVEIDRFLPNGRAAILANVSGTLRTFVATDNNGDGLFEFTGGVSTGITFASGTVPAGVDYNGDGRADLEWIALESGTRRVKLRANTTTGANPTFGSAQNGHTIPASNARGTIQGASLSSGRGTAQMDVNGDGLEDVYIGLQVKSGTITTTYHAASLNGATLAPSANWRGLTPTRIGNFNDDNCTDTVEVAFVQLSSCGFTPGPTVPLPSGASTAVKAWADWNDDGKVDLLVSNGTTIGVYPSSGSGFWGLRTTGIPSNFNFSGLDINGDDLPDLAAANGGTIRYYLQTPPAGEFATYLPDLLESVTDGNGLTVYPDYVVVPAGSHYIAGTPPAAPFKESDTFAVVGRVRFPDGVGGQYTKAYTYTAARDDADRGGFLGFQQIDEVDSRGGFITKAYYDQAFPKTGMINKREVYQANGTLISRTTYTNSPQALDSTAFNQRYFQHVSDILEETFKVGTDPAKDGQPLTKVQTTYSNLDAATGNIGKVTVKLTDNDADSPDYLQSWTKATTYTFAPANSSNRCISLVQSVRAEYSKGTDPASLSRVIDFTPDTGNCRVSQQIVEPSSAKYRVETTYGYDAFGNVNSTSTIGRNPDGTNMPARTTAADWGATGQFLVNSWNELNQLTAHDYNYDLGTLKSSTNPNNLTSSLLYDTFGRLEKITRPDGTASKWEVGPCSPSCLNDFHKMTMTARELNADGNTATDTISYVDQAGRTLVSRSRLPNDSYQWIENRFDARGRLAMQGIPCASSTPTSSCVTKWVQFGYDDMGRITSTTRPIKQNTSETAATSVSYDGRTTTVLDPYGKRTRLTLNARGVARRSIDENDYYQDYIYDVAGSLKEVTATDTVGTKTLFSGGYEYGALPFQTSSFERSSGSRTQTYNSVGELVAWSDSKGQQFSAKYDALSRLTERTEPDNVTKWIWGGDPALKNVGELQTIRFEPAGGYSESYSYDSLGRMRQKDITIPGQGAFSYNMAYDANTGHIDTLTYPDNAGGPRLVVKYNHSQQGVLQSVVNPNESTTYWTLNSVNTRGQVTSETYGNGIVRDQVIDTVSGLLDSIHVGTAANPNAIQNMTFSYDLMGNVTQRQNGNAFLTEDFVYGSATDASYRLGSSILKSGSSPAITNLSLTYDGAGNMLSKTTSDTSDVMLPHAVVWSSANYPTQITTTTAGGSAVETATFAYGPRRDRWKMDFTSAGVSETTYYIGGLLEKVTSGVNVEYRHYIQASDETIAILTRTSSGSTTLRYMFSDRQGTVDSVLNAGSGARLSQSFSAFGEPRNAATWSGPPDQAEFAQMAAITRQGYTFQTVLGRMGMNHMNGRVQDAVTGRFLSPDPFVGNPSNTQNFNRYAYVSNNPLTFLDPTGFDQSGIASGIPQLPNHYPGEDRDPNWDIGVRDSDYFWYGAWWQVTAGNPTAACTNMLGGTMSAAVCGMPFGIGLGSAIAQSVAAQMKAPPYFGVYTDRSVSPPSYETKCETLSCYAAGWSIPDGVYNDLMGAFDAVSVGLATRISELVHGDQVVDRNSERYKSSLVTTSILYSAVTMGASAYTTSAAAGTIAVANAGAAATTTTQLTAQQIIQNVARAEHAKGLAHLRQYLRGNEEKLLAGAKTARMITGTLVHRATDAALRTLYPGRFKYSSNKGIDFEDTVSKTFIELTTKAQSLYKQLKYGIPPSQVATY